MRSDLLLRLADLLETDAHNPKGAQFDLGVWGIHVGEKPEDMPSCGTKACAMGLARARDLFIREGMLPYIKDAREPFIPLFVDPQCPIGFEEVMVGFDAIEALFNITHEEAIWLFTGGAYKRDKIAVCEAEGELAVAARIKAFVAGEQSPPKEENMEIFS